MSALNAAKRIYKNQLIQKYGSNWFRGSKKSDFATINGQLVFKESDAQIESIKNAIKPIDIQTATIKDPQEYINTVTFDIRVESINHADRTIRVSLSDVTPAELKNLKQVSLYNMSEIRYAENVDLLKNILLKHRKSRLLNVFSGGPSGTNNVIFTNFKFFQIPNKYRALAARDSTSMTCAINATIQALGPCLADDKHLILTSLGKKFKDTGVTPDDYKLISSKLKCNINVYFGTNPDSTKIQYKVRKPDATIDLAHFNNHCIAKLVVDQKSINYVYAESTFDLQTILLDNIDRIFELSDSSVTIRNEDDSFTCYQLQTVDDIELPLGKPSIADVLLDELTAQIHSFPYDSSNIDAYKQFAKHGCHYSTGDEQLNDIDFDLEKAYSSYYKFDSYKGLPKDITNWVQFNETNVDLIVSTIGDMQGFALIEFISPLHGYTQKTVWMLIPAIVHLHEHKLISRVYQAAFSIESFDLDLSKFIDLNPEWIDSYDPISGEEDGFFDYKIGKRVFHKLLGMLTKNMSTRKFITKDPLEQLTNNSRSLSIPDWASGQKDYLEPYSQVVYNYESTANKYAHVAAAIQDYVYLEVTLEFLRLKSIHNDVELVSSLVDGFRIKKHKLSNYKPSPFFKKKGISYCGTPAMNDWNDKSTKAVSFVNESTLMNLSSCLAIIHPKFNSLINETDHSLLTMCNDNRVSCIYGYAGSGKTYSIKQYAKQCHSIILTPTHLTRIDYVNDGYKCNTQQAAQHNPLIIKDYQLVIIDEVSMCTLADINRIAQCMTKQQRLLLVGDPAQLLPYLRDTTNYKQYANIMMSFKDVIPESYKLEKLDNSFTRKLLIDQFLAYHKSCVNKLESLTVQHEESPSDKLQELIDATQSSINVIQPIINEFKSFDEQMRLFKSFIDITNPDAIPSTNIIKCKKMLTVVKRSSCSKLTKLCKMVRSNQIKPVELLDQLGYMYIESDLTKNEPNVATNEFLHNKRILTYRNIDVDEFAGADEFNTFDHFMAIKSFNIKQNGVAMQFYTNEYFTLIDGSFYSDKYDVAIDNTESIRSKLKQCRSTTFHKCQGQTISEDIYINMSFITMRALYVALTRAKSIKQIKLIVNGKCPSKSATHTCTSSCAPVPSVYNPSFDNFDATKYETLEVDNEMIDKFNIAKMPEGYTQATFDTSKFINDLPMLVAKYKSIEDKLINDLPTGASDEIKAGVKAKAQMKIKSYVLDQDYGRYMIKQEVVEAVKPKINYNNINDVKYIINDCNGQCTFKMDQPQYVTVTSYDQYGQFDEQVTYDYLYAITNGSTRMFAWFYSLTDASMFQQRMQAKPEYELHDVLNNDLNNFFMDIDYKINDIVDIDVTNKSVVSDLTKAFNLVVPEDVTLSFSQRSRIIDNQTKISIHMYTNLACNITTMKHLAKSIASELENDDLIKSIDMQPYAKNKSLSAPFGIKNGVTQTMLIGSYSPLFDICNSINLDKYTITYTNHIGVDTDSSLLEEALNYLPQCELFDDYAMEPVYASKNSHCGHIRRIKPSSCAGCNGHHSNDNTLRVYLFNGMAFAKCTRGGRSYPLCGAKPDIVIEQDESVDDRTNEEYIDDLNDQRNDILAEIEYAQADMDTERIEELELELNEIDRLIKLALW